MSVCPLHPHLLRGGRTFVAKPTSRPKDLTSTSSPPTTPNTKNRELITHYFNKWLGVPGKKDTSRAPSLRHSLVSFLQATLSITTLAFLDFFMHASNEDFMFLVGSFGATAVLLYSAHGSPLAQPRAVLMGHFVSSLAGVTVFKIMGNIPYVSAGVAVGLAIFCMERTNSVHPPGGATALVAIVGGDVVTMAGYWYVLFPCLTGAFLMLLVALFCNNLDPERTYPQYWSHYFPLWEKGRSLAGACFGGTVAGAAGTLGVPSSPPSSSSRSNTPPPPSYPNVASIELVDDADAPSTTPPRAQSPSRGWTAAAAVAAEAAAARGGTGHVINPQVLEEKDTASPV